MIPLVFLAQSADLLVWSLAIDGHAADEISPLQLVGLPPEAVIAAKLAGLLLVIVGIRHLSPRGGRLVAAIAVTLGLVGAASGLAVMA